MLIRHWPLCLAQLNLPADASGKMIKCPACGKVFMVPLNRAQKAEARAERKRLRMEAAVANREAREADAKTRAANQPPPISQPTPQPQVIVQRPPVQIVRSGMGPIGLLVVIVLAIILAPIVLGGSQCCCLFGIVDGMFKK